MPEPSSQTAAPVLRRPLRRRGGVAAVLLLAAVVGLCACAGPAPERSGVGDGGVPAPPAWEPDERSRAVKHVLAAEIAARRGRYDAALRHYTAAMRLTEDGRVAERAVRLAFFVEDAERAEEAVQRWRELAPQRPEAYQLLGVLALRRGAPEEAREALARFLERTPGDVGDAFLQLGVVLEHGAPAEEAAAVLAALVNDYADVPEVYRVLAAAAHRAGKPQQALQAAERSAALAPADRGAGLALLRAIGEAVRAGALELDAAVERLGRLRRERAELADRAVLLEAELLFQAGRFAAAVRTYSRGLEASPGDPDLLYGRGLARAELGDIDGAEADLRRVLERRPEDAFALNALGYTLADQGRRLEEAEALIDRALAQEPESAAILDSKGWLRYRQGRLEAALDYLERAFAEQAGGEIGAHLGEVLWELGQRQRAREVWGKAWEADPGHPLLEETLETYGVEPDAL